MATAEERRANVVLTADTSQYTQGMQQAQAATSGLGQSIDDISNSINKIQKSVGKGLIKFAAADIASFSAMSAIAATLEKQTSEIQSNFAVLGRTSRDVDAVTNSVRNLSREIPMARNQIAALATQVSNLGFTSSKQIEMVTTKFSKMGIATGEIPAALASSMVQFQRTMGYVPTAQTMGPPSQAVTYLSAKAGAPAQDILGFAQGIAPAARVAGLNQSTILGMSAAAARTGAEGQYAASTISQILNTISALRTTGSPEIKRFANALNMRTEDFAVRPGEDTDKFMRGIISRIISLSSGTNEQDSIARLNMMGLEGIRARRAIQTLSAEPGGIDRWTNQAIYGAGTKSIETGYAAATDGLIDEMEKLRNKFTDMGQSLGEPMTKAFTEMTKVANKATEPLAKFAAAIGKIVGIVSPTIGMAAGALGIPFLAWRGINRMSMLRRGIDNVGSAYTRQGFRIGSQQALGTFDDAEWANNAYYNRFMNGGAGIIGNIGMNLGMAAGSMFPNLGVRDKGIGQKILRALDVSANYMGRESQQWYKQALRNPETRQSARELITDLQQEIRRARGTGESMADLEKRINADDTWRKRMGAIPGAPNTFRLGDYAYDRWGERLSLGGVVGNAVRQSTGTAVEAGNYGLRETARLAWNNKGAMARLAGSAAALPFEMAMGAGRMFAPVALPMAAMGAATYAYDAYQKEQEYNKKFTDENATGFSDEELDNLQAYNEELGIATSSLSKFAQRLDETNPAKTEDARKELMDDENVRNVGREQAEFTNKRISQLESPEQAKEFIAAQESMTVDEIVLLFRDLAKQFENTDYSNIRDWYLGGGAEKPLGISNLLNTQASEEDVWGKNWYNKPGAKLGTILSQPLMYLGMPDVDLGGIKNNEALQSNAALKIGAAAQISKTYGEYTDVGSIKGSSSEEVKSRAVELASSYAYAGEILKKAAADVDAGEKSGNPGQMKAEVEYAKMLKDALVSSGFDKETLAKIDFNKFATGGQSLEDFGNQIDSILKEDLKAKSGDDDVYKAVIESGLDKYVTSAEEFGKYIDSLGTKDIATTTNKNLESTVFAGLDEKTLSKYFGKDTTIEKAMTGGLVGENQQWQAASDLLAATGGLTNSISGTIDALQQFKSTATEGTQAWNAANLAIEMFAQNNAWQNMGSPTQALGYQAEVSGGYLNNALSGAPSDDARSKAQEEQGKWQGKLYDMYSKTMEWEKSRVREEESWKKQSTRSDEDFYRNRERTIDAHQRQVDRSTRSFQRNMKYSEASFQRSLKYQEEDFYRSREREQQQHSRQMKNMAEDMAKQIGDPYNRIQMQLLSDPQALLSNMRNRAVIAERHSGNIDKLRGMGMSEQAMQQLNVFDFNNSQQVDYMVKTITPAMVEGFNKVAEKLVGSGGEISKEQTDVKRAEEERAISLVQAFDDFIRQMKRTKTEHSIQVSFSKKEFKINLAESQKEFDISLRQAKKDYDRTMDRAAEDRATALRQQTEDIYDLLMGELEGSADIVTKITGAFDKFGGEYTEELKAQVKIIEEALKSAEDAIDAIIKKQSKISGTTIPGGGGLYIPPAYEGTTPKTKTGAGAVKASLADKTNEPEMCLNQVSRWYGGPGIGDAHDAADAWRKSKSKHPGTVSQKPPAGVPVYWSGGAGHVALSLGNGYVRTTDWPKKGVVGTTTIKNLTDKWGKGYLGWAGDLWGSGVKILGDGGVVTKPSKAILAERGTPETVIPLDNRGVNFMKAFQINLANEMVRSMPKTPMTNVSHTTSYSTQFNVQKMEIKTEDPIDWAKKMKLEQSRKNAALYKA